MENDDPTGGCLFDAGADLIAATSFGLNLDELGIGDSGGITVNEDNFAAGM